MPVWERLLISPRAAEAGKEKTPDTIVKKARPLVETSKCNLAYMLETKQS